MAIHERIRLLSPKLKHYLVTFNLFPSVPPTNDQYELQNQKISTRLFIILLTLILTILLLYTSLATITKTVIVKTPTLDQYLNLYAKYPQTLTCECTKISIDYEKLVNVQYSLHQVCTSDFISEDWINYLASSSAGIILNYDDFRWTATYSFQALRAFCELMNTTISNSLDQFYSSEYISAFVIPSELLQSQVQASIDQFKSSTEKSFLLSLSLIQDTTQGNELYSAVQTNYLMFIPLADSYASTLPRNYSGCTCDSSAACGYQSTIQNYSSSTVLFTIPGFYVGCNVIESLLKSTLQCFYNQTCISILQSFCTSPVQINVRELDPSLSSQYFVNSTIQELVNNLMVEEWNSTETYNGYYDECQPAQCIYTYTARNDLIYIVTTLIGLLGGLITVLKLVVPALVKFVRRRFGSPRLDTDDVERQQFGDLLPKFKHYLVTFNLFPSVPPTNDQYELQNQKTSTRLFIILLTLILTILLLYTSLATITNTAIVNTPTLDQYLNLYAKYPQTLTCPCTKISIDYEKLVNVQYSLHQVCTSDFVTDDWINYLVLSWTNITIMDYDFRWTGASMFRNLRAFCELMNTTISNSLDQFYLSKYVSAFVIPSELLQSQVQASIDQFKSSTEKSFLLSLSLIQDTTQANALYSATLMNFNLLASVGTQSVTSSADSYDNCGCDSVPNCGEASGMYEFPTLATEFMVPGFYTGCFVIASLLRSTLQCFYNQTCISILQSFCTSPVQINVRELDPSLSSQYFVNSTIQELVNNLMVEEWNSTETYNGYYDECQPSQCIYTYTARNDLIYIVTTLIGLLGGLITVLKLVVPALVKFVRRKFRFPRSPRPTAMINIHERIQLLPKIKHYLVTFNLFPSVPPTNDQYELQNQKTSTRLFIILLTLILTILLLYTSLATITKTVIVKTPTLDQYLNLYAKYPQTLTCPCTKISIDYEKLVNVQYSFHQVCTSDFVTDDWINYLASSSAGIILNYDDFRWTATYSFQALRAFCELMNTTISNSLDQFYSSEYISAFVIPSKLLQSQVQASIDQFKSSTEKSFLLSLSLIQDTNQGNALLSGIQMNYYMLYPQDSYRTFISQTRVYGDCGCDFSPTCGYQSTIQNYSSSTVLFTIPGFYVGCNVIESLLKSTLQCFYNQTCISILESFCISPTQIQMNATALDSSLSSQYFVNSTIQELVNNLMVEEWNSTETYNGYYDECQPAQCIYTYTARNDLIYIVTTLIGLLGGLITVLKLVVPRLVKSFMHCILKRRPAVSQISSVQT